MWLETKRDLNHLVRASHFEIQASPDNGCNAFDVGVLNVSSVLSQVCGDAIRARRLTHNGGRDWIGLDRAPGLTNRRHVIDVNVQTLVRCSHARGTVWVTQGRCCGRRCRVQGALVTFASI